MTPPELLLSDRLAGFTTWAEVDDVLHGAWLGLLDGTGRALVHVPDGLGLLEPPGSLSARERRGLHRLGFRLQHVAGARAWLWLLPVEESPVLEPVPPARRPFDVTATLRRWQEESRLARQQALRTLRDVLRADVRAVAVVPVPEDEHDWDGGWDDWWDCGWDDEPGDGWDGACSHRGCCPPPDCACSG